jgi:phage FluMu protein Com
MKKKIVIKDGDKQPIECPKCKEMNGYQRSDYLKTHYTTIRNSDGSFEQGFYSDYQPLVNRNRSAYCPECITKLPFWVDES